MGTLTDAKLSGLALIAAVVLTIILFPFIPGAGLGNIDLLDFYKLTEAMQDGGLWTYISNLLTIVVLLLLVFGFVGLLRYSDRTGADTLVRWGSISIFLFLSFLLVGEGMDLVTVHVVDHGIGRGTGADQDLVLEATAATLQSVKFGLRFVAGVLGPLGFFLISISMLRGTTDLGVHKVFPIVMLVLVPIGLVAGILSEYDHDLLEPVFPFLSVIIGLTFLYPFVFGWGLYRKGGDVIG